MLNLKILNALKKIDQLLVSVESIDEDSSGWQSFLKGEFDDHFKDLLTEGQRMSIKVEYGEQNRVLTK